MTLVGYDDPVAFVKAYIDFPDGEGLAPYQEEAMWAVAKNQRVVQYGPHGSGRTCTTALLLLWFALTREDAKKDWKCITTAPAWRQIEDYMWPEVHKWARRLRWDALEDTPFTSYELLTLNLNLGWGSARAVEAKPSYIEAFCSDALLFLFDNAAVMPDNVFDAMEGAFSGSNLGGREAYAYVSSTPNEPQGRFYDIARQRAGFEDWTVFHISKEDAIAAERIHPMWAEERKKQWGQDSAMYRHRVLGEFAWTDPEEEARYLPEEHG